MAKKNNINITSKNTYISSKALKKAETPSGDNKKEKQDEELKKAPIVHVVQDGVYEFESFKRET